MGLFDKMFEKKLCCLCGAKTGMISRQLIAKDDYLCGDCAVKCSSEITAEHMTELTKDEICAQLALLAQEAQFMADGGFCETETVVKSGLGSAQTILSVDGQNGYWRAPQSHNGFVYEFSQVKNAWLELDTCYLTEEERRRRGGMGAAMNFLAHMAGGMGSDPRLPMCPPDSEITGMKLYVQVDHLYADMVVIPVMDALIVTESDIQMGYRLAAEILGIFDHYTNVDFEAEEDADAAEELSAIDAIKKYKELLDLGAITQEEFDAKKEKLLNL